MSFLARRLIYLYSMIKNVRVKISHSTEVSCAKKVASVFHYALQLKNTHSSAQKKFNFIFSLICFEENIMFDVSVLLETSADSGIQKKYTK